MKTEHAIALTVFLMFFMGLQMMYMQSLKFAFTLDKTTYEQVGVMQQKDDNGEDLYIPVFKKRITKWEKD